MLAFTEVKAYNRIKRYTYTHIIHIQYLYRYTTHKETKWTL